VANSARFYEVTIEKNRGAVFVGSQHFENKKKQFISNL
jgi:hypothetical protein